MRASLLPCGSSGVLVVVSLFCGGAADMLDLSIVPQDCVNLLLSCGLLGKVSCYDAYHMRAHGICVFLCALGDGAAREQLTLMSRIYFRRVSNATSMASSWLQVFLLVAGFSFASLSGI